MQMKACEHGLIESTNKTCKEGFSYEKSEKQL